MSCNLNFSSSSIIIFFKFWRDLHTPLPVSKVLCTFLFPWTLENHFISRFTSSLLYNVCLSLFNRVLIVYCRFMSFSLYKLHDGFFSNFLGREQNNSDNQLSQVASGSECNDCRDELLRLWHWGRAHHEQSQFG